MEIKSILWAGGGDPMESPNWKYALRMSTEFGFSNALYSYLPKITQNDVNFISQHCKFVMGHNTPAKVKRPEETKCRWICGWLVSKDNWKDFAKLEAQVNYSLFDSCYFRPLLSFDDDYSWGSDFGREMYLKFHPYHFGNVDFAQHKFSDLKRPDKGRTYKECWGTFLAGAIGADGSVWECCNRMGPVYGALGNIFKDGLANIYAERLKPRTDFKRCPPACKNQKINQVLWDCYLGPEPEDVEFL
jgi:hypothetical protein